MTYISTAGDYYQMLPLLFAKKILFVKLLQRKLSALHRYSIKEKAKPRHPV